MLIFFSAVTSLAQHVHYICLNEFQHKPPERKWNQSTRPPFLKRFLMWRSISWLVLWNASVFSSAGHSALLQSYVFQRWERTMKRVRHTGWRLMHCEVFSMDTSKKLGHGCTSQCVSKPRFANTLWILLFADTPVTWLCFTHSLTLLLVYLSVHSVPAPVQLSAVPLFPVFFASSSSFSSLGFFQCDFKVTRKFRERTLIQQKVSMQPIYYVNWYYYYT